LKGNKDKQEIRQLQSITKETMLAIERGESKRLLNPQKSIIFFYLCKYGQEALQF